MSDQTILHGSARDEAAMTNLSRYANVEALAFAIVRALEDRDSGLIAEIQGLRQDVAALCEEVSNLNHVLTLEQAQHRPAAADVRAIQTALRTELAPLRKQVAAPDQTGALTEIRRQLGDLGVQIARIQPGGPSGTIQDAIRSDLTRMIERLNAQSRADQVVALREEVRAQLGTLDQAAELRSLRLLLVTELAGIRGHIDASRSHGVSYGPTNSVTHHDTNGTVTGYAGPSSSLNGRAESRRASTRVGNVQGLLHALRYGDGVPEPPMLRPSKRGRLRAVARAGAPEVVVSG